MEATVDSPYLTYEEAARYCNVEQASGPGTAVRFHLNELDRWMNSRNEN